MREEFDREVFVQACDSAYGAQGLALYRSLQAHATDVDWRMVWVCLDHELFDRLSAMGLEGVTLVRGELLTTVAAPAGVPGLADALAHREGGPWFWTWAAQATWWAGQRFPDARVTYLDTDILFYSTPRPILQGLDLNEAEVGIFTHRFPPKYADRVERGIYNVGWVTFDASEAARGCLAWWAEKVREICLVDMPALKERLPDGTWWERGPGSVGDQPWLEAFPQLARVRVLDLDAPGAAIAPYNFGAYQVSCTPVMDPGGVPREIPWARLLSFRGVVADPTIVTPNQGPVIFYHAHEEKFDKRGRHLKATGYPVDDSAREIILEPYYAAVASAGLELGWGDL